MKDAITKAIEGGWKKEMSKGSQERRKKVPAPPLGVKKNYCEICGGNGRNYQHIGRYDKDGFLIHKRKAGRDGLTIHHKDHNAYNNELSNLQTLCNTCHVALHKREQKATPQ